MQYKGIEIEKRIDYFITIGLIKFINKELKILVRERGDEEYIQVLTYLIDYAVNLKIPIAGDQTISHHSWILKFIGTNDKMLSLWEATPTGNDYCEGVDYAIKVTQEQKSVCDEFNVAPSFPDFSQNIVISKGVYENLPVEGVRYPSPNYMTGWWITTDLYDGNFDSLMNVHYFHVAFARPDLLKYLALPNGFRFFVNNEDLDIWYDEKVS